MFYKSAAACFACHDPAPGTTRLGPNLKTMTTKLDHAELVDSILRPSKRIEKEFAQVNVITDQGKQFTGIRVSETDDELVIRNLAQPEPMVFKKSDLEEVLESRTSLMPANLTRMLKNRGEFNDLMKYVLEIRKR